MSGLVVAEQLVERGFRGHIVVMTLYETRSYVEQALQAGVKGFVQKRSVGLNLLLAIRSAMLGGSYFDPLTASEMLAPPEPEMVNRWPAGESRTHQCEKKRCFVSLRWATPTRKSPTE